MPNYFSTEIGRIRSEEMVARGLRYQATAAKQRAKERQVALAVPRRHRAYRRTLVTVGLSFIFMVLASTAAFAYPANPGSTGSHVVAPSTAEQVGNMSSSSSFDPIWIVALLGIALVAAASAFVLRHRQAATA